MMDMMGPPPGGLPSAGPPPGMGAPMGAPPAPLGAPQPGGPASLLATLLGPLAPMLDAQRAEAMQGVDQQFNDLLANLVSALSSQPSPQGMQAVSGPAPAGLGVEAPGAELGGAPAGLGGAPEDDFGGAY